MKDRLGKMNRDESKRKRILLAENDRRFRSLLASELALAGYDVVQVSDGQEALDQLLAHRDQDRSFHFLLTDLWMPNLSGFALIRSMHEHGLDIPMIIMTGDINLNPEKEFCGSTVVGFFRKPFHFGDLRVLIDANLAHGSGSDE